MEWEIGGEGARIRTGTSISFNLLQSQHLNLWMVRIDKLGERVFYLLLGRTPGQKILIPQIININILHPIPILLIDCIQRPTFILFNHNAGQCRRGWNSARGRGRWWRRRRDIVRCCGDRHWREGGRRGRKRTLAVVGGDCGGHNGAPVA